MKFNKIAASMFVAAMFLLASAQLSSAAYVTIIQPFNYTVTNSSAVYLGKDGPGQTFYVTIAAATMNSSGAVNPLGWNKLVATNLPQGWIAQNSSLYTPTLSVKITPSATTQNGTYAFNLTAVNVGNYSKLGALRFTALVNVTPDVFKLGVSPMSISEGTGKSTDINITINNTGVSDSLFLITITGVPAQNITDTVIALHGTSQRYAYPITIAQPGRYMLSINVGSVSSALIQEHANVTVVARAGILSDYAAIGGGVDAFPIVYEPLYAVMYLISRLFAL